MSRIHEIALSRLHGDEYIKFFSDEATVISENTRVSAAVKPELDTLHTDLAALNGLFATDPASPLTKEINALDAQRDELLSGLIRRCDADTHHPDPAVRAAAGALARSIAVYGSNIANQGQNAETTVISGILADWQGKPALAAAATLLPGLSAWTDALTTVNENFKAKYLQRTGDAAASSTPDTFRAKRQDVSKAWTALCEKIDANLLLASDKTEWQTVVARINAVIDGYNSTLRSRAGRAAAKGSKPPEA